MISDGNVLGEGRPTEPVMSVAKDGGPQRRLAVQVPVRGKVD
jgi:hypothetical protein